MRSYRLHDDDPRAPRPLRIADNAMFVFDDTVRAAARPPIGKTEAAMNQGPRATYREPGGTIHPGPGEGVLSIAVDAEETAPVIAVDGRPVAAGAGQLDLVLPVGAHSVEVQGARTVDPVVVRIEQEAVRRIGYYEDPLTGHRVLGDFPETLERVGDNSGCLVWIAQAALLVGVIWALVAAFVQQNITVAVVVAAATALVAAAGLPLSRLAKRAYRRKRAEQLRLPARAPEPYPWGADGDFGAVLRGGADPGVPPGRAAIDLDLECARHLRIGRRKAASGGFLARMWTPPPRVEIDGVAQPASWGRWRYAVAPGPHRVSVAVDGRAANVTVPVRHDGAVTERGDIEVTAQPGAAVTVRADADVFAAWRAGAGQVETRTPTLRLEAN
ncbi:hypothetical protein [Glycomyces tenuis]|uniref:hypothetical protein n=1 Tax=Glycomyces tenuis TaxID=58116 RepID=UPI000415CE04|nr:hypothetical protein [Glycomyces tenuis]